MWVWLMVHDDQVNLPNASLGTVGWVVLIVAVPIAFLHTLGWLANRELQPFLVFAPFVILGGIACAVAADPSRGTAPYMAWGSVLLAVGLFLNYWRVLHAVSINHFHKLRGFWVQFPAILLLTALLHSHHFGWGLVGTFLIPIYRRKYLMTASSREVHLRGTQVATGKRVAYEFDSRRQVEEKGFLFGGAWLPEKEAVKNLVFIGAAGSGKTISLRLYIQCVMPQITQFSGKRALIHDYTRTFLPLLRGMGVTADIHILNLFDGRASGWAMSLDITTLAHAQQASVMLAPAPQANEKSDKFFRQAAQVLLEAMIVFLQIHAPGQWTLRDVVLGLSNLEIATALLMSHPATQHYLAILGSENTSQNILSSVFAEIKNLRIIAALDDMATRRFSIREWLEGGQILLLGNSTEAEETLNAFNRLVVMQTVQMLLQHTEARDIPEPESYFILDELNQLGHLPKLPNLAETVRARGGSMALCFQSYKRLCEIYGNESAAALMGQCGNKALLRLTEPETSDYASKLIGEAQIIRKGANYRRPQESGSLDDWRREGLSESIVTEAAVLASELRDLPPVEKGEGLAGYYLASDRTWKHRYTHSELAKLLLPPSPVERGFMPVPDHYQRLRNWDQEDWSRLGITTLMLRMEQQALLDESPAPFRPFLDENEGTNPASGGSAASSAGGGRKLDLDPEPKTPPIRLSRRARTTQQSKKQEKKPNRQQERRRDPGR